MAEWFLIYFGLNVVAFWAFARDKRRARVGRRRISERTLIWATLFGGIGAFAARRLLRHKTRKEPFATRFRIVATIHVLATLFSLLRA